MTSIRTTSAPPAAAGPLRSSGKRWIWLAAAVVAASALLVVTANVVADRYQGDNLWRNALASLGGVDRNGDFGYVFLPAGDKVLEGQSPYLDPDAYTSEAQAPYAYPPVLAFLITPFSALPERVEGVFLPGAIFSLLLVLAVVGALLLLDVRDWRCYPVALLYPFTLEAVEYGAIGPILLLLIAAGWRLRDRPWAVAAATGGAVVFKLFLWPLVVWLAATRRVRSAALGVATAVALALLSWSLIVFGGIADYPRLLRKLVDFEAEQSYSAFAVLRMLEIPEPAARAFVVVAGITLLALAWRAARSSDSSRLEQDRQSLILTIAAALVMTPILWLHYLVLLLVPIALARPRLSLLWLVPLVPTIFEAVDWYRGWPRGDAQALLSVAAVVAIVFIASLRGVRETARRHGTVPARA